MKTILRLVGITALALSFGSAMAVPTDAQVAIGVSVNFAPPDLPIYEQPSCPGEDYIWTPGYWAWDNDYDDYYWVPGTWVLAPEPGFFWTPGYWVWGGSGFVFTAGYWGPVVGFYGGINYGYGYFGHGYEGGRWDRGHFYYNREVNNVNVNIIHNTYNTTIVNRNENVTRVSYNGGNGGISARATAQEEAAAHERHIAPVAAQTQHVQEARSNPELRSKQNQGRPPIAATARPNGFTGNGVVAARQGGSLHGNGRPAIGNGGVPRPENNGARTVQPENNNGARPNYSHARDIPTPVRPPTPNTGNPKLDQKYQQEQEKLAAKQAQEQLKLQQKQEQEHQKSQKQQANAAKQQQMEQRHQQQTQQMVQRHEQQVQQMKQRQQPPPQPQPKHPPHNP